MNKSTKIVTIILIFLGLVAYMFYAVHSHYVQAYEQLFRGLRPCVLYHGSPIRNLNILKPVAKKSPLKKRVPLIFATPHISLASIFLVSADDSWSGSGSFDYGPYYFFAQKDRFLREDRGGTIYVVESQSFFCLPKEFGLGWAEWASKDAVQPCFKLTFESALEAMLTFGVQVFLVDGAVLDGLVKNRSKRRQLLGELEKAGASENRRRSINQHTLFDSSNPSVRHD